MCFFKQKTAYEMRISDWSSDVCSSDLIAAQPRQLRRRPQGQGQPLVVRLLLDEHPAALDEGAEVHLLLPELQLAGFDLREVEQIVDEDRKSVVSGKGVSVRVDLGGRRILKKKII